MLILRGDVTADFSAYTPDDFAAILGEYEAWSQQLTAEGRMDAGNKLTDQGGMVIHPRPGQRVEITDGPFVEAKEVVGGYYIIKADSYQHAAKLCHGHPNLRFGSIEIREVDFMGGPED
jgi:hypothetical protein